MVIAMNIFVASRHDLVVANKVITMAETSHMYTTCTFPVHNLISMYKPSLTAVPGVDIIILVK